MKIQIFRLTKCLATPKKGKSMTNMAKKASRAVEKEEACTTPWTSSKCSSVVAEVSFLTGNRLIAYHCYYRIPQREANKDQGHGARAENFFGQALQRMQEASQNHQVYCNKTRRKRDYLLLHFSHRHILCPKCDGVGGTKDAVSKCQNCHGRGMEIFNQQIGPGMIQRIQRACSQCGGEGEVNKDPCKNCKGKKRVNSHYLTMENKII
jgi:hypothetical protein